MLIDSHCHIPHSKYEKSSDEIINEAKKEGVEKLINIGTSISDSRDALEISKQYENVYSTVGVYPHDDTDLGLDEIRQQMEGFIQMGGTNVVGIGECGVDIPQGEVPYKTRELTDQKELFKLQIGLAVQHDLPLVIHNRDGDKEVLEILNHYKNTGLRGIMHCFVSDWEYAQKLLDLDFYISFTGIITYPSAGEKLLEVVKKVPHDRFLVETDAPYLAPQKLRGQINYPKYVKMTAAKIAELRNTSFEEISEISYRNTCQLFNI
jgi:TatD DNase family protein